MMNSYYLLFIMCVILSLIVIIYQKIEKSQDLDLAKKLIKFFVVLISIKIFLLFIFINRGMTLCYLGKTIFC
jgi:hypothetical protein